VKLSTHDKVKKEKEKRSCTFGKVLKVTSATMTDGPNICGFFSLYKVPSMEV